MPEWLKMQIAQGFLVLAAIGVGLFWDGYLNELHRDDGKIYFCFVTRSPVPEHVRTCEELHGPVTP